MKTFKIITLGCKVNAYESQAMAIDMEKAGYVEASDDECADIYIIHTCAVTNTAAFKSRQKIRQAIKANEDALIVAAGCYVQTSSKELSLNKDIDVLIGSSGKSHIAEIVTQCLEKRERKVWIEDMRQAQFEHHEANIFEHQCRAYLKIQDGCNQFCSYCIIPYSRGKERSLEEDKCVECAKHLCESGHREIVLTGIHTGRYGKDVGSSLVALMKRILTEVPTLERLRLSSIEVNEISDELIELMKENPKVARHLHIPLQAGCDKTLKAMNRPYTTANYYDKLCEIRQALPDISISSDVIVGFPGESDEDFQLCVDFIRKCELSFLHVFPFSLRKGTAAEKLGGHLTEAQKKERVKVLLEVSNELKRLFAMRFMNKEVEVMIENREESVYRGYTSEYIRVEFKSDKELTSELVRVRLVSVHEDVCYGEICEG